MNGASVGLPRSAGTPAVAPASGPRSVSVPAAPPLTTPGRHPNFTCAAGAGLVVIRTTSRMADRSSQVSHG